MNGGSGDPVGGPPGKSGGLTGLYNTIAFSSVALAGTAVATGGGGDGDGSGDSRA